MNDSDRILLAKYLLKIEKLAAKGYHGEKNVYKIEKWVRKYVYSIRDITVREHLLRNAMRSIELYRKEITKEIDVNKLKLL